MSCKKDYQTINSKTIDRWVEEGWQWGIPVTSNEIENAKKGSWNVYLSPTIPVPHSWFGSLKDKKILGLASGGGQQIPIFSILGAKCTVLDYSKKQCESEISISKREGYDVEVLCEDMTKPLPFNDETFDIIFHPVSNCYVEKVEPIFKECFRVLKKNGLLMCGLDNGINYIFNQDETEIINTLPFNPLVNKEHKKQLEECDGGIQFSHTLTEQIGGQLKAGFTLLDLYEDTNGEGNLHNHNIKSYICTLSKK